jgi:hypothetical protein
MARPFHSGAGTKPKIALRLFTDIGVLKATSINSMKTLLSILSILALTITVMWLDAGRLDAGVWFLALAVAGLFGIALNDGSHRRERSRLPLA